MLGLSPFGQFHTVVSLLAMAAAVAALWRYREISLASRAGQLFVLLTVASCVTGLFLFRRGSFGPPHALAVLTLAVLGGAVIAERWARLGRWSRLLAVPGFSLCFFFHFIPGFTETLTRLPADRPFASSAEDPRLALLVGTTFVLFLVGIALQLQRILAAQRVAAGDG